MAVYARILRTPGLGILIAATLITRLPLAINGLAVVLYLRETTGSFAIAGLVAGAMAVGSAIGAPLAGRLVDRRGAGALMPLAIVHAAAILAVWALAAAEAPAAVTAVVALIAGAGFPPTGALLRSRLPRMLGDDDLVHSAYALDSVGIELSFVTGPLITAVLVALAGPQFALAVSATLMLLGTALFLAHFPDRDRGPRPAEGHRGWLGPLADRGLRTLALSTVPVGFCLGAIEVAIPAFSSEHGATALAGVLLAVWSAASGVGGLLYGTRAPSDRVVDTFLALAVLFPLACLPLALAWSPAAMAVLVVLAGLADRAADREPQPGDRRARPGRDGDRVVYLAAHLAGRRPGSRQRTRRDPLPARGLGGRDPARLRGRRGGRGARLRAPRGPRAARGRAARSKRRLTR